MDRNQLQPVVVSRRVELSGSGDFFYEFFDKAAVGIALVSIEGRWLDVNKRFCLMTGYSASELMAKTFQQITHPDDLVEDLDNVSDLLANRTESYRLEKRYFRKDGSLLWVELCVSLIRLPDGSPNHFVVLIHDINDRKLAEARLAESELQMRQFVRHAPVAIALFDTSMRYLAVSDRFMLDYGLSPDQRDAVMGRCHYDFFPDLPARWLALHQRVLVDGVTIDIEQDDFIHADGHRDWVRWRMEPWRQSDGAMGGAILFAEVITARVQAKIRLAESEARFRALLDNAPEKAWVCKPDGETEWFNAAWRRYTGQPLRPEGDEWMDTIHPRDRAIFREEIDRSLAFGRAFRMELRMRREVDSIWRRHITNFAPMRDDQTGAIWAWIGTATDIQELQEAEALMRTIGEVSQDLLYAKDRRSRILYANPATMATIGKPVTEIIGHSDAEFYDNPAEAEVILASDRRVMETGTAEVVEEIFTPPGGTERVFLTSKSPMTTASGEVIGLVGVTRDITDRKVAERQKELLVHELNHRVKNTLASVLSLASQTLRPGCVPDVWSSFERRLIALASAHDLLTQESWQAAELYDIFGQVFGPYQRENAPERITFDGPGIRLEPKAALALNMAFHELATNAAKYGSLSTDAGRVHIAWRTDHDELVLQWQELDGPRVTPPDQRGFGSRLLERGLSRELNGTIKLAFAPEGVTCRIAMPLRTIRPDNR